jgi:hypothetical protein
MDLASNETLLPLRCARCDSPLEPGDLRCAICSAAAPRFDSSHSENIAVTLLRCTGCGAAITYDADLQSPACSFCGEQLEVQTISDPMEQTEFYLPMTISRETARTAFLGWLATRGWFTPSDLSASSQLTEMKPLWWVAWIFDAEALVSWTADSNAGAGRSAWAPHAGQNAIAFDNILVSGSRGLMLHEVDAIAAGFDCSTGKDSPQGGDPHAMLERFDVPRSQARERVSAAIHTSAAARVQNHFVPGTRFRNLHISIVLRRLVTRRYALPAYVLAYRYRGQLYRVVICGQDARYMVGSSPFSYLKLLGLVAAVGLGLLLVSFVVIALSR